MNALIIGRFQVPNKILKKMIEKAKQEGAEKIVVVIGSANEYGTDLNPLSSMLRSHLIHEIISEDESVTVTGMEDMENDKEWEERVLLIAKQICGEDMDILVTGDKTTKLFKNLKIVKIRREPITDDDVWKAILRNDEKKKEKYLNEEVIKSSFIHVAAMYLYKIKVKGTEPIYDFDFRGTSDKE